MSSEKVTFDFPVVGDGSGVSKDPGITQYELQLAARNRSLPLEALRYDVTPTGMHYLLVHFDVPYAEENSWTLEIGGEVSSPITLSMAEIRAMPQVKMPVTMECAGNGRAMYSPRPISQPWLFEAVGTAEWTGTPLGPVLELAGLKPSAHDVVFTGSDRGVQGSIEQDYQRSLSVAEAMRDEVMLVYEMNGHPLQPQHGFPLRLIVPGWYGMTSVKWLERIEVIDRKFDGYQMESYSYLQEPGGDGVPVDLIRVRALMVPPGIPDFLTRTRIVDAGPVQLTGRAWAGRRKVARVEISDDGGASWLDAKLAPQESSYAWAGWTATWNAEPGRHTLCVRATDEAENTQPLEQQWNLRGMGNNMVQRVDVIVRQL
jgi:DMSO/TMAO reductase YedYZ molybdopterin-dependent catalytic subunit